MPMTRAFATMLLLAAATTAHAGPAADAVAYLYAHVDAPFEAAERDRFTGPARALLDANDAVWEESQEACLDFSFVVDGQDWDEAEIAGSLDLTEAAAGDGATVTARFTNFGEPRTLDWTLVRQGGVWRVADVASAEGAWRLSELSCG
jgi:hypothetical protein